MVCLTVPVPSYGNHSTEDLARSRIHDLLIARPTPWALCQQATSTAAMGSRAPEETGLETTTAISGHHWLVPQWREAAIEPTTTHRHSYWFWFCTAVLSTQWQTALVVSTVLWLRTPWIVRQFWEGGTNGVNRPTVSIDAFMPMLLLLFDYARSSELQLYKYFTPDAAKNRFSCSNLNYRVFSPIVLNNVHIYYVRPAASRNQTTCPQPEWRKTTQEVIQSWQSEIELSPDVTCVFHRPSVRPSVSLSVCLH